ncbi:hypothetical protein F4860DRAFT_463188 [Xylaria cubensis]|nr:hypothetical protein F4860DRAFT_463188 [Xylaria cubensis]
MMNLIWAVPCFTLWIGLVSDFAGVCVCTKRWSEIMLGVFTLLFTLSTCLLIFNVYEDNCKRCFDRHSVCCLQGMLFSWYSITNCKKKTVFKPTYRGEISYLFPLQSRLEHNPQLR